MGCASAWRPAGFGSVADNGQSKQPAGERIVIHDVDVEFVPEARGQSVRIDHAGIIVPGPAFRRLVASAAGRAGVTASGSLADDLISVAVSVSLLRLTATFSATVADGLLVLEPRGGLPGWLLGRAAPLIGRTSGLTMGSTGRITVDPSALVPPGVSLRNGFTAVHVDRNQIRLTIG